MIKYQLIRSGKSLSKEHYLKEDVEILVFVGVNSNIYLIIVKIMGLFS